MTFTIGRGNELCAAAVESLAPLLIGRDIDAMFSNLGHIWKTITGESQLRWLGPEKGVIHLAGAAIINAIWDLYSKSLKKTCLAGFDRNVPRRNRQSC